MLFFLFGVTNKNQKPGADSETAARLLNLVGAAAAASHIFNL